MRKRRKKKIHVGLHGKVEKLRQTLADVGGAVGELAGESGFRKAKQVCQNRHSKGNKKGNMAHAPTYFPTANLSGCAGR